jgi:hypothetical protein
MKDLGVDDKKYVLVLDVVMVLFHPHFEQNPKNQNH